MNEKPSSLIISTNVAAISSLPSPAGSVSGSPHKRILDETVPITPISETSEDTFVSTKSAGARRCNYCGATSTPMWRHGPNQYTNLCNSCGVKWRRGKILNTGEHRHHLYKPSNQKQSPSPKVKKSASTSDDSPVKTKKRKAEETSYWERQPRARTHYISPAPSPEPEKVEPEVEVCESEVSADEELAPIPALQTQTTIMPTRLEVLTGEFADLLEQIPSQKVEIFRTILANCFQPKIGQAYKNGQSIEMNVLDIDEETWDRLRVLVY